jgi:hypothetical protein
MNSHILFALEHPVFDPEHQILLGHGWRQGELSFLLTANIGME